MTPEIPATLRRWAVVGDPLATRRAYEQLRADASQRCGCIDCQNFYQLPTNLFPSELLNFVASMGIDLAQPAEVTTLGERGDLIIYHGWYHFVGNIQSGRSGWRTTSATGASADFERLSSTCEVGFSFNHDLLPSAFAGLPVVQLDFTLDAPWVLTDAQNPPAAG